MSAVGVDPFDALFYILFLSNAANDLRIVVGSRIAGVACRSKSLDTVLVGPMPVMVAAWMNRRLHVIL